MRELRWARDTLFFVRFNLRARVFPCVTAVDASTTGFGVVERVMDPAVVQRQVAWAERWRYRADNTRAAPRTRALEVCHGPPQQAVLDAVPLPEGWHAVDSFAEMTRAEIGADDLWTRVCAIPWKQKHGTHSHS